VSWPEEGGFGSSLGGKGEKIENIRCKVLSCQASRKGVSLSRRTVVLEKMKGLGELWWGGGGGGVGGWGVVLWGVVVFLVPAFPLSFFADQTFLSKSDGLERPLEHRLDLASNSMFGSKPLNGSRGGEGIWGAY